MLPSLRDVRSKAHHHIGRWRTRETERETLRLERETERFRERKLKKKVGECCVWCREFLLHDGGGGGETAVEVWEILE
ncbi:hypothetical protein L1987_03330 [Smallanthus sonchifolius]|uniref:Uncharacterized protein n=1 Tax=Smallanthus sonchifolius TaxID=185202 RepID=A0ACB9KAE2_9ASTR|nr:hypothetical protein L1987_03330 [Smallanthus sonchifolius]